MTSTSTRTATKTFTRMDIIKTQVRIALRRTTNLSLDILKNTFDKGLDNHWIKSIVIYGINKEKYCCAQLILEIDWVAYNFQLTCGTSTVTVDEKWKDDTAIELDELINLFNEYVSEHSLAIKTQFIYADGVDVDIANEELGAIAPDLIKWEHSWSTTIPEIPELRIGCYFAEDS